MAMLDRMTKIGEDLTRLGTTIHPNSVMIRFVRQLPGDFSSEKHLLQGPDPDRHEILKRVRARYKSLRS